MNEKLSPEQVQENIETNACCKSGAWASELHRIGNRWYIYAAASCHPTQGYIEKKMRTFVLKLRTEDPFDGFDFAGIMGENEAAIDAGVWHAAKGKLYIIKLMEAEDNLKALRNKYTELVDEVTSVLDQITDEYGGDILTLRFVKMRSMKDIGRELHLGKTQVNEHYQSSLDELEKILKKSELDRTQPNSTELNRTILM